MNAPLSDGLAVLVATRGRPAILHNLLRRLEAQTRVPDHVIVVGADESDVAGVASSPARAVVLGPAGSARQRNEALRIADGRYGTLVFFDDDFVPSRFWLERAETWFSRRPDLAALTGTVLADGIKTSGIPAAEADAMVSAQDRSSFSGNALIEGVGPYGCNMAFRASAIAGLRFDDRLPLYAWLEDSDFGAQVARRGMVARAEDLWGVHLGHKTGRGPGVKLGYSQMVNPVYLCRKGTLPPGFSAKLMTKNIVANAVRSLAPEPMIDRAGRLRGNLIGLGDLLRGRVTPERAALL